MGWEGLFRMIMDLSQSFWISYFLDQRKLADLFNFYQCSKDHDVLPGFF